MQQVPVMAGHNEGRKGALFLARLPFLMSRTLINGVIPGTGGGGAEGRVVVLGAQ